MYFNSWPSCSPLLECKLIEGTNFCLFCLLLFPGIQKSIWHIIECSLNICWLSEWKWASQLARQQKTPPAVEESQEMQVLFQGQEDPLEEGTQPAPVQACLQNPMKRGACRATTCGVANGRILGLWARVTKILCVKVY